MQKLFSEFPSTNAKQWKEQLIKDLKGIDYNSLIWKTNTGIDVQPFYTKDDLKSKPEPLFTKTDWAICENIIVDYAEKANAQALNSLQNGASGLVFHISHKIDYSVLLKDILLKHIYALFIIKPDLEYELTNYLNSIETGNSCFVESDTILEGKINTRYNKNICVSTNLYQEAGANAINELAFSLAQINEYLNISSSDIQTIHINVSVGGDFFMEIAKLRALRKLVYFLIKQYALNTTVHIHAQTTLINKSGVDSYNNMLRSTTEAMSAAIGGANSIVVLPFDFEFNEQNDFSSRMARNQQLILKEESYLHIVSDIAAGSYYIESLTETLCEKAWSEFKMIESKGGLVKCLETKYIQNIIHKDAEILIQQFKEGELVLVGVNKFQNNNEEVKEIKQKGLIHSSGIKAIKLA